MWNLTEDEQDAIMRAVEKVTKPWMERKATSVLWENEDGSEEQLPISVTAIRADAPEEVKALDRVYMTIIEKGAIIGSGLPPEEDLT